jgi:hypothetical protein
VHNITSFQTKNRFFFVGFWRLFLSLSLFCDKEHSNSRRKQTYIYIYIVRFDFIILVPCGNLNELKDNKRKTEEFFKTIIEH